MGRNLELFVRSKIEVQKFEDAIQFFSKSRVFLQKRFKDRMSHPEAIKRRAKLPEIYLKMGRPLESLPIYDRLIQESLYYNGDGTVKSNTNNSLIYLLPLLRAKAQTHRAIYNQ